MSAIKTCSFCGRLFTGALSNSCFGCELNESSPKKPSNTHAAHQKNIQPVKYPPSKLPQNNQQAVAKITKCNQCDFSGTKKQLSTHNVSHIKVKIKFKSSPKKTNQHHHHRKK
jgi:hypothetical protein